MASYSLIVSYGDDLNDVETVSQKDILLELFGSNPVECHDLGWTTLAFRVRNKSKRWVKRARFFKFNFLDDGSVVRRIPLLLKNLTVEPLRFSILRHDVLGNDLNSILT